MEWVETTGDTLEEAKNAALDQLGIDPQRRAETLQVADFVAIARVLSA